MNTKISNRILSFMICLVMLVSMMPATVFAAGSTPVTTNKVYTYQRIDSVDDIVPGKHFIIVAEYTNDTTGETTYHALGAKMAFYDGFRYAYQQDSDDYHGVGKTFEISEDKKTITTYYNDTNYTHNYKNDYSINEPEHGILRLRFEPYNLTKNQYRFAVDGHGYMFGFTSRGNDGTAGHHYHAKMPIGTSTSGALWWQLSVGENGYWQICTQTTYGSYDGRVTGYERIQSYIYPHHGIAATEVFPSGNGIEYLAAGNTGILIYMETACNHYIDTLTHTPGKAATCTKPGIREHWYCADCETYFANEAMTEEIEPNSIFLPALTHSNSCGHASENVKFELCLDPPNGSNQSGERYILIGKAGDKYYAMGNVTNADGSRNAVEVTPGANGIIPASSHSAEFLTYYWPSNGAIGFIADDGYLSVNEGSILAYDQSLYNVTKYVPDPADFIMDDYDTGAGNFRVYSSLTRKEEYIGFDAATLTFKGQSEDDGSTYLYRELCPHEKKHMPGVEATCTRCGSAEYWYCDTCWKYFGAADGSITLEENQITTHAAGHTYKDGACLDCGLKVPVYNKVTSEDQLGLPGTYIIVATDGTNTYVLQAPINEMADLDNNGILDIEEIDLDGNGTPDIYEQDNDGNGRPDIDDLYDYDYTAPHVIPVTPNSDGSISVLGLGAAEFEMIKHNPYGDFEEIPMAVEMGDDSSSQYYFWMPNGLLNGLNKINTRFSCFINGEGLIYADETCAWGISFGNNLSEDEKWQLANAQFAINDDTAILYAENCGNGATCALRLRLYDGTLTFVTEHDEWLPGATEKLDGNGNPVTDAYGNAVYDTNDIQYGVYLYYSAEGYAHVHQWSNWTADADGTTHSRTCSASGCPANKETKPHSWDHGVETKAPTCTQNGVKTFTCVDCGATKTEAIAALGHDWSNWSDDGANAATDTHSRSCQREGCTVTERLTHSWGAWESDGDTNHKKTCSVCSGVRTDVHKWNDGEVTKEPTEDTEGIKTYTCTVCGHTKTEPVGKLPHVHSWSEWGQNDENTHIRSCRCDETQTEEHNFDDGVVIKWATHLAPGEIHFTCADCGYVKIGTLPALEEHEWGNWIDNKDGTHTRSCICNETETQNCTWDAGVVTKQPTHYEEGMKTYTCTACGHTYTEDLPVLTDHAWGEWVINKEDAQNTHIHFCVCGESQIAPHNFDNGKITTAATHTSKGVRTFTCTDGCGYSYTEEIPATPNHEWSRWRSNNNGTHTRSCSCNATETRNCTYNSGVVTKQPTHTANGVKTYTCTVCGDTRTESVAKTTEHKWGNWVGNDDGRTHTRACECGVTETAAHNWGAWAEQAAGGYKRSCADCGTSETLLFDEEKPINTTANNNAANTNLTNTDIELIDKVLTSEEQSQVAGGTEIKIYLKVEDISNKTPAAHKVEAEAKAGDNEIGMYLDIALFKQLGTATEVPVTKTAGAVTITITIPENLINTDASVTRTYKIIRVHEDENGNLITDVIEGAFNPEDNTFTFETDKFSTYALAYADNVVNTPVEPNNPQTGENNNMMLWIALFVVGGFVVAGIILFVKKRFSVK